MTRERHAKYAEHLLQFIWMGSRHHSTVGAGTRELIRDDGPKRKRQRNDLNASHFEFARIRTNGTAWPSARERERGTETEENQNLKKILPRNGARNAEGIKKSPDSMATFISIQVLRSNKIVIGFRFDKNDQRTDAHTAEQHSRLS